MTQPDTPKKASAARECICHASWSGYNEQEWMARGCPKCECWKIDEYEILLNQANAMSEALEYYGDETENFRVVNVCKFSSNLNRFYVCGNGEVAREALNDFKKWKEGLK